MAKIRVNKIDAARRQIGAAIRLLFDNDDPVAIHTLQAAGFRILRDLSDKSEKASVWASFKAVIRPGMEKEAWAAWSKPANFFKHADRDADEILDNVDESINEAMLFMASLLYQDLGYELTPEMKILMAWMLATHPQFMLDSAPLKGLVEKQSGAFRNLNFTRAEQLDMCRTLLTSGRTKAL